MKFCWVKVGSETNCNFLFKWKHVYGSFIAGLRRIYLFFLVTLTERILDLLLILHGETQLSNYYKELIFNENYIIFFCRIFIHFSIG